jgi:hypothetical protein
MNNINELLQQLDTEEKDFAEMLAKKRETLRMLQPKLEGFDKDLSLSFCGYGNYQKLDFNYPGRETTVTLIAHIKAGKWDKTLSGANGKIDYVNKTLCPLELRIYAADPPGSCKIVEIPEEVPAQPARIVIRKKVVCTEHQLTPTV